MSIFEAEQKTGLKGRFCPEATVPFLQCQLGETIVHFRSEPPSKNCHGYALNVNVYLVRGWGETWEAAVKRSKREAVQPKKQKTARVRG